MGGRKDCLRASFGTSFESKRWLSLDISGLMGIFASCSVHLFSFVTAAHYLISESMFSTSVFLLLYTPSFLMAMASLFMAWTTDPGAVPMGARPLVTVKRAESGEVVPTSTGRQRGMRRCNKCGDNFKPARAHHDSVTGRCIVKFDHFCPWVGNAVGALNHKFFVLFVFYTMCTCLSALLLLMARAIHCGTVLESSDDSASWDNSSSKGIHQDTAEAEPNGDEDRRMMMRYLFAGMSDSSGNYARPECAGWFESRSVLALLICSIVFLVFTCCMLVEQIEAIDSGASKIARMQMRVGRAGTELSRVTEEFNEMFGGTHNRLAWHWFVPIPVEFPGSMSKVVLGYEYDETFDPVPYDLDTAAADTDVESGKTIEMPTRSSNRLKDPPPNSTNGTRGPPAEASTKLKDDPRLTKRMNSRGSDDATLDVSKGTMT